MEKTALVKLQDMGQINSFVSTCCSLPNYHIDLHQGRMIIEGKSLLGLLALDLSVPVKMYIFNQKEELIELTPSLHKLFSPFIVEEEA